MHITARNVPVHQQPLDSDEIRTELAAHKIDNQNVEFVQSPGFFVVYFGALIFGRFLIGLIVAPEIAWTILNIGHAIVTEYLFHWIKGAPFTSNTDIDVARFDKLTWWEQLDNGVQWTWNKKALILIPTFLYLFATHSSGYDVFSLLFVLNTISFLFMFISKMPWMHRQRILGINKD